VAAPPPAPTGSKRVTDLDEPAEVAAFVAAHPGAPVVVDARWEELVAAELLIRSDLLLGVAHLLIVADAPADCSARSTRWRAMGGKTKAWKGATDHQ
jgi:hypothetical protein